MKYTITASLYEIESVSLYEIHSRSEFVKNTVTVSLHEIHRHGLRLTDI